MYKIITTLFLFLLSSQTQAANYCAPAEKILNKVNNCSENDLFIDQAEKCLENLEKDIAASKALIKFSDNKAQNQAQNINSAAQNLQKTELTLITLISLATQASEDIDSYLDAIVLPEDSSEPYVNGGNEEAFVNSISCYGETKKSIESVIDDVDDITEELEAAKLATSQLKNTANTHVGNIQTSTPGAGANQMQSQGTGTNTSATRLNGSSISGKIKDEPKK